MIDVIKVCNIIEHEAIDRELALVKVHADPESRSGIVDIVEIFRAKIVDVNRETMVIEMTGDARKIDALCAVLQDHGVVEMVRTGKISLSRGPRAAKEVERKFEVVG